MIAQPAETESLPAKEETIGEQYSKMMEAIEGNSEKAQQIYEKGLDDVRGKNDPEFELLWQLSYEKERSAVGQLDALDNIRKLASQNPDSLLPESFIGSCLFDSGQFEKAADHHLRAVSLSKDNKGTDTIKAAICYGRAKKFERAVEILINLWEEESPQTSESKFRILDALQLVLKESGKTIPVFAIRELAQLENPGDNNFRFSIAYDYEGAGYSDLSLYHYKLICGRDSENAGALNNIGVAYSKCGLPIFAASKYRLAYKLGNTLSASNLGRRYLGAGLVDDAEGLLRDALNKENCDPQVHETISMIHESREKEAKKEESNLETAENHRRFLLSLGEEFLSTDPMNIEGTWRFPFVEMELKLSDGKLAGTGKNEMQELLSGLGSLLIRGGRDVTGGFCTR